jgi:hypothetical protein
MRLKNSKTLAMKSNPSHVDREKKQTETLNIDETIKSNDAMINHLSKEIETISNNTMSSRNTISFSLWVGPFLLLGSILVATEKGGLGLKNPGIVAWAVMILAAASFFGALAYIIGQVEEGAWDKCNEWRECIIRIQAGERLSADDYRKLVPYKQLAQKVSNVYRIVFAISFALFAATVFFISQLLDLSRLATGQ